MRRTLALLALVAAAATAAPAAAAAPPAPDAVACTQALVRFVLLYDGMLEDYPGAMAGAGARWADCVA